MHTGQKVAGHNHVVLLHAEAQGQAPRVLLILCSVAAPGWRQVSFDCVVVSIEHLLR